MVISVDGVIGGGVWSRLMRMPDGPPIDGRVGVNARWSFLSMVSSVVVYGRA